MIYGVSFSVSILAQINNLAALTDDVLNNTKTDATGNFIISGSSSEVPTKLFLIIHIFVVVGKYILHRNQSSLLDTTDGKMQ